MSKKIAGVGLFLMMSAFAGSQALGADNQTTANIDVSLEIVAGCSITSDGDVDLSDGGIYDLSGGASASNSLTVVCSHSPGLKYTVGFGQGNYSGKCGAASNPTNPERCLKHESKDEYIAYNIYQDSSHNQIWGDLKNNGADGTTALPDKVYGDAESIKETFYVWAYPSTAELSTGTYSDTVLVTVAFSQ